MKKEIETVNDLMSKYGLTKKDLFSFCICAVNFLEYYVEEAMCDVMWSCPDRYYNADSDNTKAVAGALNGEKKEEGWTDEEQFYHYMEEIQSHVEADSNNLSHFLSEFDRFEKVYKREVFVPIMLGCPVEDYDDSRFLDRKYLKSIANADNLTIHKAAVEKEEEDLRNLPRVVVVTPRFRHHSLSERPLLRHSCIAMFHSCFLASCFSSLLVIRKTNDIRRNSRSWSWKP